MKSQKQIANRKKGLRHLDVTLSGLRDVNFSDRDDDRGRRECQRRIPLFWRPVVPG